MESRNRQAILSMFRSGFGFGRSCVFCMGPWESKQTSLNLLKKPGVETQALTLPVDLGLRVQSTLCLFALSMASRELLGLQRTTKPPPGIDILIYSHHSASKSK